MKTKTKKQLTEEKVIEARDHLFRIKSQMEELRQEELEIREYLVDGLYPADKEEGATTVTVGNTKVTVEKKYNRSISQADADALKAKDAKLWAEVLSWSPKIRNGVYKDHRKVMDQFITTSAAPSTVTFK